MLSNQLSRFTVYTAVVLLLMLVGAPVAHAQEAANDEAPEVVEEEMRRSLDLGSFKIHDLRPTRNETAKLTFDLHLALTPDVTKKQIAELEHWKHRLRNQVIIAVRTIETKDFQAADLGLLRRKILLRVNRLLKSRLAEEVLLTKYLFRLH